MTRMPLGLAMRKAINRTMTEQRVGTRRMTVAHLARVTGLPDKNIRRRMDGEVDFDATYFEAICEAMGVDIDAMWALARRIQKTEGAADDLAAMVADPEVDAMREKMRRRKAR